MSDTEQVRLLYIAPSWCSNVCNGNKKEPPLVKMWLTSEVFNSQAPGPDFHLQLHNKQTAFIS